MLYLYDSSSFPLCEGDFHISEITAEEAAIEIEQAGDDADTVSRLTNKSTVSYIAAITGRLFSTGYPTTLLPGESALIFWIPKVVSGTRIRDIPYSILKVTC